MRFLFALLIVLWIVPIEAQPIIIDLDQQDKSALHEFLDNQNIVAIGELHGTIELPLFILDLARIARQTHDSITVALEISKVFQPQLDAFLESGKTEILESVEHFKTKDGRSSVAMAHLLKGLHHLGGVKLVCFDVDWSTKPENRDSLMAVELSRVCDNRPMLILTGNLHASINSGWKSNEKKTAMHYLREMMPAEVKMISLNAYFGGGNAWNCTREGCGVSNLSSYPKGGQGGHKNFLSLNPNSVTEGFNGIVYFENAHASPPFLPDSIALQRLIGRFKMAISQKDSNDFKMLFFSSKVSFVGIMSGLTEMSIKQDYLDFQGLAVSNSTEFIRQICLSEKAQREEFYNTTFDIEGNVASVEFDYTYHSGERMVQWGHEKWNLVFAENQWLITDVIYSIHFPDVEKSPY